MQIINYLKLEKYLKSVVGSEMPKEFPLAALQAQAIAARTYALKLLGKNEVFDIHSTQASQVYLGLEAETAKINRAVRSTSSLALFYENKLYYNKKNPLKEKFNNFEENFDNLEITLLSDNINYLIKSNY